MTLAAPILTIIAFLSIECVGSTDPPYISFSQLHEVLEKFLDDDTDMHRLHLTAEEMARQNSQFDDLRRKRSLKLSPSGKGGGVPETVPEDASADQQKGQEDPLFKVNRQPIMPDFTVSEPDIELAPIPGIHVAIYFLAAGLATRF